MPVSVSEPMSAAGTGAGASGVLTVSEYGGEYSPAAAGQAASSLGYPSNSWPGGQLQQPPSAATGSATGSAATMGHRLPGAVAGMRSSSSSSAWGEGGGRASPGSAMDVGEGAGGRDMWRPPERTPPSAAAAQRGWGAGGDMANAPPRGEFPLGGSASGAGGALPSIFQLQQRGSSGTAVALGAGGGGSRGGLGGPDGGGAPAWGGRGAGFQQEQPIAGEYDNRWGGALAAAAAAGVPVPLQHQQQEALGHIAPASGRWQEAGGGGGGSGEGSAAEAGIPRGGSFDRSYGGFPLQGRHRGGESGGGGSGQQGNA